MNELHLVGYTADLKYVVFSDADGGVQFRTPVDADLLATFREIADLLSPGDERRASKAKALRADQATAAKAGAHDGSESGEGALVGVAVLRGLLAGATANGGDTAPGAGTADGEGSPGAAARPRNSRLSPREIQAQLRAGISPRLVARSAGTDESWVQRWLPPIEAERERVLRAVQSQRVSKARLGPSAALLGDSVAVNLRAKGLDPDGEEIAWAVTRREGDAHWQVALRYRSRGRVQRALWRFDPDRRQLDPRNALAVDLAWTRRRATEPVDAGPADADTVQEQPPRARRPSRKAAPVRGNKADRPARRTAGTPSKRSASKGSTVKRTTGNRTARPQRAASERTATSTEASTRAAPKRAAPRPAASKEATGRKATAVRGQARGKGRGTTAGKASTPTGAGGSTAKKATVRRATPRKRGSTARRGDRPD